MFNIVSYDPTIESLDASIRFEPDSFPVEKDVNRTRNPL